jgi:hypothetical protein
MFENFKTYGVSTAERSQPIAVRGTYLQMRQSINFSASLDSLILINQSINQSRLASTTSTAKHVAVGTASIHNVRAINSMPYLNRISPRPPIHLPPRYTPSTGVMYLP